MSVYSNPKFYSGVQLLKKRRLAKDGQTWQADQFGRITDSGVVKARSAATAINLQFAETQAVATSSSKVKVYDIPAGGTKFVIGVTNAGSDTKALVGYIGGNYGLAVNSCVCTLSTGNDSTEILHVEDVISNVSSNRLNDTSDIPGYAIVSVIEAKRVEQT